MIVIRKEVAKLVELGPFPALDNTTEEEVNLRSDLIDNIAKPVSDEEAEALKTCFGPDDYYGVAWSLLHLIETAPSAAAVDTMPPPPDANEWIHRLWRRAENGRLYKAQESKK